MASVIEYGSPPSVPRDTRTLQELFTSLHRETVEIGPRGVLVVFGVLFSSSATLLVRSCRRLFCT